ncbi:MAG: GSCFA domain-containing protein [Crocinitomicaceae bacterium]|nr:GSCFA domain-containing protein [Crocinitomicaceae bacterium]MBK8925158.1 GSCFA domain-containing protein [Crocinitomicaceae bacterium]
MQFRTETKIIAEPGLITYGKKLFFTGSCFADEIGNRLTNLGFDTCTNPSGILFNPVSLADYFYDAVNSTFDAELIVQRDDLFFHYGYHSKLFAQSKQDLQDQIQQMLLQTKARLLSADTIVITLGTAWVYRHTLTGKVVANCHKIPQKEFTKELLQLDDLKKVFYSLINFLFEQNKNMRVVLTVSPVRHTKDGLHENNLSKGVLHLLSDYLVNEFKQVSYFPAYELVLDDLRDYRFYKEDLVHPTHQAIDFVFEKMADAWFDDTTKQAALVKSEINKLKRHRPITENKSAEKIVTKKLIELEQKFELLVNQH